MKNNYRLWGTIAALTLIVIVPNVFANTSVLSNDPEYAEGFTFYCEPYLHSFEVGKHYLPTDGYCVYSIPATIVNTPVVGLYQGTPGNSTLQSGDGIFTEATLVRQEPNTFFNPSPEDDYFAVVYDIALDQGSGTFDQWLRTGGEPPVEAIEGENYYFLPWKWGSKPVGEFDPVIVIPDILTTWPTDEGLLLDPMFSSYENLTATLESSGYIPGQTLFTFTYDWQNSNVESAEALKDLIDSVKSDCDCERVDLVGHGMGGLIAVHYIESGSYEHNVDQLITLGTPLFGVPSAYRAWEGGEITFGNPLQDGVWQTLLAAQAEAAGHTNVFEHIQATPITSFLELTPALFDYLSGQSYPDGYPINSFGENILTNFSNTFLVNPIVSYTSVLGDNNDSDTPIGFDVTTSSEPPKWAHGEPVSVSTDAGDGMVPRVSIENILGTADQDFSVAHEKLPTAAQSFVFETLNGAEPSTVIENNYSTSCVLFLTVSQGTDLQITDPNGDRLGKDFSGSGNFEEIDRSIYSGPNMPAEYLGIANPIEGTYQLRAQGTASGSFTLTASDVCEGGTHSTSTQNTATPGQIVGYSVTVGSDDSIEIATLDNSAPTVTITTPQNGTSYLTTDNIFINVTISDPESSPIAQTTYRVNGNLINHLQPLATSSLATSTLVVAATDVFGNTGYATSTFAFRLPPPPPPAPNDDCIMALSANTKPAVAVSGSAQINAPCKMQVNSNGTGAVEINGSSKITTSGNCIVGTLKKSGSATMSPNATIPCPAKADPYAAHAKPSIGTCNFTNYVVNGSQTRTLNPGVYCGGLDFAGSAKVTLNPGIYIVKDGDLTINGSAKVTGNGVAFFLTGSNAAFNFGGSADIKLSAPTSGILDGFVFFLNSAPSVAAKSEINGSAKGWFDGIVYLPKQELRFGGSVQAPSPTPVTTYIADTFLINGSAKLHTNGVAN